MLKKILFLGFTVTILIFSNNLFAEINSVVPLKKPILSKEDDYIEQPRTLPFDLMEKIEKKDEKSTGIYCNSLDVSARNQT